MDWREAGWSSKCLRPVCLLPALQLLLWHSALWSGQEAIPLVTVSSPPPSLPLPRSFLLKSLEQVRKIQASSSVLLEQLVSEVVRGVKGRTWGVERKWEEGRLGTHSSDRVCLVCTRARIAPSEY